MAPRPGFLFSTLAEVKMAVSKAREQALDGEGERGQRWGFLAKLRRDGLQLYDRGREVIVNGPDGNRSSRYHEAHPWDNTMGELLAVADAARENGDREVVICAGFDIASSPRALHDGDYEISDIGYDVVVWVNPDLPPLPVAIPDPEED